MGKIDDILKTKFMNDKHRFIANLVYTSNTFQANYDRFFKQFGISSQQYNVLRILKGAGDWVNMNDVKKLMIDKTPNTTRLSDKLLSKEYINRKRSESDRRVVFLEITSKGSQLLKEIDEADNSEQMMYLTRISDEEAQIMSNILDKMRG